MKKIVSEGNLGVWFDKGGMEANKVNPVLPVNNLVSIGFIPSATGNTTNLNEFVTDPSGNKWFIDYSGDAMRNSSLTLLN